MNLNEADMIIKPDIQYTLHLLFIFIFIEIYVSGL